MGLLHENFVHESFMRDNCGLLVVDVQQQLMQIIDPSGALAGRIAMFLQGCHLLQIPCVLSEQYPKGLGPTIESVKAYADPIFQFEKTTFSCVRAPEGGQRLLSLPYTTWIVVGIEAHVCILQTVVDLRRSGKQVFVPIDAVASRSEVDKLAALDEMRAMGVRLTTCETLLFECLQDSKHPLFKQVSSLVKSSR